MTGTASDKRQAIARLTPLADVLALVSERVQPVAPRSVEIGAASGRVLAADATVPALPASAIALQDGWAVAADATLGAGSYAPALLPALPPRIEAGEPMPAGVDSVAPVDAVEVKNGHAQAFEAVSPGDGVLPAGGDANANEPLRRAGERLRLTDTAVLAAAGLTEIIVREPRVRVLPLRADDIVQAAARLIAIDIARSGALEEIAPGGAALAEALTAEETDLIVAVGGTGSGRNDNAVLTLAEIGTVAVHGIALTPGETAAFGFAGAKPVLLLPGRLDSTLSVWLTIGRAILRRLAGAAGDEHETAETLTLARKIASTVGLTEIVPVRRQGGQIEPLASKYLSLSALARADSWALVPAESEGYSVGSLVRVRPWP